MSCHFPSKLNQRAGREFTIHKTRKQSDHLLGQRLLVVQNWVVGLVIWTVNEEGEWNHTIALFPLLVWFLDSSDPVELIVQVVANISVLLVFSSVACFGKLS
eukprot:g81277.t1